jgi:hypothetical protein
MAADEIVTPVEDILARAISSGPLAEVRLALEEEQAQAEAAAEAAADERRAEAKAQMLGLAKVWEKYRDDEHKLRLKLIPAHDKAMLAQAQFKAAQRVARAAEVAPEDIPTVLDNLTRSLGSEGTPELRAEMQQIAAVFRSGL